MLGTTQFPTFRNYLPSIYIICIFHLCISNKTPSRKLSFHCLVYLAWICELLFSPIHDYEVTIFRNWMVYDYVHSGSLLFHVVISWGDKLEPVQQISLPCAPLTDYFVWLYLHIFVSILTKYLSFCEFFLEAFLVVAENIAVTIFRKLLFLVFYIITLPEAAWIVMHS